MNILDMQQDPIKMLLIGDSGSGKTGALISLAEAGYNLRILDFDKGLDILRLRLKGNPEAAKRVEFVPCQDKMDTSGGNIKAKGTPEGFSKALRLLDNWKYKDPSGGEIDFGKPSAWTNKDIIVLDSLTFASMACLRRIVVMDPKTNSLDDIWLNHYGDAANQLENLLALLYSDYIRCNVIITSHITFLGGNEEEAIADTGYPMALGKKLPPKIGRYFNTCLQCVKKGTGGSEKRVISTVPVGNVVVKSPLLGVPRELPIESGLATYFKAWFDVNTNTTKETTNV